MMSYIVAVAVVALVFTAGRVLGSGMGVGEEGSE